MTDAPEKDIFKEQEKVVDTMFNIEFLNNENSVFSRTEGGFIALKKGDDYYERIDCCCAFPHTAPDEFVSVRDKDGKEIGIIKNVSELNETNQALVKEQISRRYFTPVIKKVLSVKEEYGYTYWDTVTDKGCCRFTVAMGGGSTSRITENRVFISDIDGNKFEIPDITKLSAKELKMIDIFL